MYGYDIFGDGTFIYVTRQEFIKLVSQFANDSLSFANSYIVNHASGLADFGNEYYKSYEERIWRQHEKVTQEIEDYILVEQLDKLVKLIHRLSEMDDQIIAAYQETVTQNRRSKKPIRNLKREVYSYLYKKRLPPPPAVVQIAKDTSLLVPEMEEIRGSVHKRIEYLLSQENTI